MAAPERPDFTKMELEDFQAHQRELEEKHRRSKAILELGNEIGVQATPPRACEIGVQATPPLGEALSQASALRRQLEEAQSQAPSAQGQPRIA